MRKRIKKIPKCYLCDEEAEYHMGGGGWTVVYTDGPNRTIFLCARHREAWFQFNSDYAGIWKFGPRPGEDGWLDYWDKIFNIFVQLHKGEIEICPFCGQVMPTKYSDKKDGEGGKR